MFLFQAPLERTVWRLCSELQIAVTLREATSWTFVPAEPGTIFYFPKIRKSSTIVQRRSRVKVIGVVMPSPVGPAMENDA